jgi:hypothetical protein
VELRRKKKKRNEMSNLQRMEMRFKKVSREHFVKIHNGANEVVKRWFFSQIKSKRFCSCIRLRLKRGGYTAERLGLLGALHAKFMNNGAKSLRIHLAELRPALIVQRLHRFEKRFHFVRNFIISRHACRRPFTRCPVIVKRHIKSRHAAATRQFPAQFARQCIASSTYLTGRCPASWNTAKSQQKNGLYQIELRRSLEKRRCAQTDRTTPSFWPSRRFFHFLWT